MTRKLTLSMDDEVVQKAKRISQKRGKSISKMVEEFINSLPDEEEESGILKIQKLLKDKIQVPEDIDYKEEWHKHLDEKYGQ